MSIGRLGAAGAGRATAAAAASAQFFSEPPLDFSFVPVCPQPTQSPYEIDLLHPLPSVEANKHKLKRLVQTPNSFFMDVKCPGCFNM